MSALRHIHVEHSGLLTFVRSSLVSRIDAVCKFPSPSERTRIISGLRWIGLFSQEPVSVRAGNLLDTLCAQLEKLMQYGPAERDLILLQHKLIVEWKDGKTVHRFSFVVYYFSSKVFFITAGHAHVDTRGVRRARRPLGDGALRRGALRDRGAAHARRAVPDPGQSRTVDFSE